MDENVPHRVVRILLSQGHDVKTVAHDYSPGIRNSDIAEAAIKEDRVIVTLDSDFLKLRKELLEEAHVIVVQAKRRTPDKISKLVSYNLGKCLKMLKRKRLVTLSEEAVF